MADSTPSATSDSAATRRPTEPDGDAWQTWFDAVRLPGVDQAIGDVYARLDEAVSQRGPTCWISGRCCNFDAYGHRMYVTALEIAWVVAKKARSDAPGIGTKARRGSEHARASDVDLKGACMFQVDGLCGIHGIRPLGCRVFFCQEGTQDWQQDVYERFLSELRALHDAHGLPYRYMEWRAGLHEALAFVEADSNA